MHRAEAFELADGVFELSAWRDAHAPMPDAALGAASPDGVLPC
jgi:hypothetical protein